MPAKLDRCVSKVKKQLTEKYKDSHDGSEPSLAEKKKIATSSWAICNEALESS